MMPLLLSTTMYLLALINPPSKIFLLASIEPGLTRQQLWQLSLRASLTGWAILMVLACAGRLLFSMVFHVELYSLQIVGGIVLFIMGLTAIREGVFFSHSSMRGSQKDLSIVPLAAPMIAGPGTITAAISYTAQEGLRLTLLSLTLAVLLNFAIMLMSLWIHKALDKFHAIGPLVRITGLIVAAVAVQMFLNGLGTWVALLLGSGDSTASVGQL